MITAKNKSFILICELLHICEQFHSTAYLVCGKYAYLQNWNSVFIFKICISIIHFLSIQIMKKSAWQQTPTTFSKNIYIYSFSEEQQIVFVANLIYTKSTFLFNPVKHTDTNILGRDYK